MSKTAAIELVKKTLRFGAPIALGNVALTYGRKFLSPETLAKLSQKRNDAVQSYLEPLVNKVLSEYRQPEAVESHGEACVWVCWLQGEDKMPPLPAMCLESIRRNAVSHPVRVISLDNFREYVDIDNRIVRMYNDGLIKNCHFADILRVCLLAQRGGAWFDATLYCSQPIDEVFFNSDFHSIRLAPFGNFVSRCRWAVYCLGAKPGNRLFVMLERLFSAYLEKEHLFIDYFLFDQFIDMLYKRDEQIREMIDNVPMSNPHIMDASPILLDSFKRDRWNELVADTDLFKLNWKLYSADSLEAASGDTYYGHMRDMSAGVVSSEV